MQNSTDRTYHHGNLRQGLIEAALAYIKEGNANFTLRNVAQRAGVSHAAPYNHFKNKHELLSEVAAIGFDMLREALENASAGATNPKDLFFARCQAFLNFAISSPEHYRLMVGPIVVNTEYPRLVQAAQAFNSLLLDYLAHCAAEGFFPPEKVGPYGIIISAQFHGLAMLAIDGRLTWYSENLVEITDNAIDVILRGLRLSP